MRGRGCGVSANEYSCAHGVQINFGDLTLYLTYAFNTLDEVDEQIGGNLNRRSQKKEKEFTKFRPDKSKKERKF